MKNVFIFVLVSFISGYAGRVENKIDQMQQQQKEGARGFILKQRLIPPEELFSEEAKEAEEPTEESSDFLEPIPQPSSGYVSYDIYINQIMKLNEKVLYLENNIERLVELTSEIQDSAISNRAFMLKIIELLITATVGGGGIAGSIFMLILRRRKKKVT